MPSKINRFMNFCSIPLKGDIDPSTGVKKSKKEIVTEIFGRVCSYLPFWPCLFIACCPDQICSSRSIVWLSSNHNEPFEKKLGTIRSICVISGVGTAWLPVDLFCTLVKVISRHQSAKRKKEEERDFPVI